MVLDLESNFVPKVGIFCTYAQVLLHKHMAPTFIKWKAKCLELLGEGMEIWAHRAKPTKPKGDTVVLSYSTFKIF